MSFYLMLDLLIIGFPLLFGFLPPVRYYKRIKALMSAILVVGIPFVVWDIVFTKTGVWAFNPDFVSGVKFASLPVEELLFFVVVPYSCLFILECLNVFFKDRALKVNRKWIYAVAAIILIFGLFFADRLYTVLVAELAALFLILIEKYYKALFASRNFWTYMLIGFGLFFGFNYVLTSLPVVTYSALHISNIRAGTIPVEDFLYNFVLLGAYAAAYSALKK